MPSKSTQEKSTQIAIILSGIFPGVGQFYNEDWAKGAAFFIASLVLDVFLLPEGVGYWDIIQGKEELTLNLYLRLLGLVLFRIVAVLDAERSARRKNAETKTQQG